jgi:exopolyphosphatase / guanosine-5'-triphosphate,3'-diphosphate pyrophosphatase
VTAQAAEPAATTMRVSLGRHDTTVVVDQQSMILPVGIDTLVERELLADPPRPEELTNAIGAVFDHFDDVVRELPAVIGAAVEVEGAEARAIAAVEVGGPPSLPFVLTRLAAEDVFRTLATEPSRQRSHNPGLEPSLVDTVVAGCCALVAVMRRLHLDEVTVLP